VPPWLGAAGHGQARSRARVATAGGLSSSAARRKSLFFEGPFHYNLSALVCARFFAVFKIGYPCFQ